MAEPVWFHIDVNSAFLSWTAAYRTLVEGRTPDLREIPSVIANDKNLRTSIVLAKSTPAKKYGVKTGEPLGMARDKCPNLVVAEPDYALYVASSPLYRGVCDETGCRGHEGRHRAERRSAQEATLTGMSL